MRRSSSFKLNDNVFSLASNLFGFGTTQTRVGIEKTINQETLNDTIPDNKIKAVYPAIIDDAFAQTMDNYRKYIAVYNLKIKEENTLIDKHNQNVKRVKELSEIQKQFSKLFEQKNVKLRPKAYNDEVDAFCADYGMIVSKQKIQTVKYTTEIVFQNLLHLYNAQLRKRNEQYIKLGVTAIRPLQEFKINSFLVTQLKRNEINSLSICSKTVRNHRQRLEEAGVFVEYHFAGQNRAVEVHINPEILVVLDMNTSKITNTKNQLVTLKKENLFLDNNENTGTLLNESKKKENVDNNPLSNRSSLTLTPSYLFFTGTHTDNEKISTEGAGEKIVKSSETLSERLQDLIIHPQELAVNLMNKEYNNYKPIDIRYLYKEAYNGTLTNEEFRELAIQDFFKTASKIWKNSTPYSGSWKKAITLYYENKWIAFTGNAFNKSALVEDLQQMRWRIEWARKWFFKNDFSPLFPYDYFDMTRKTSKEVGFEYTKKKWQEHLESSAKYRSLKKRQDANAIKRKETINHSKKYENEVARFLKNKITMPQLFDYVEKNLPKEFLEKLPTMIERKVLKQNERIVYDSDFAKFNLNDF